MTTSTTEPKVTYAGNDSTTEFSITFDFLSTDTSEVKVELITDSTNNVVLQTDPTEYSISGTTVTMVTAPATGETLVLTLNVAESQATDYTESDAFPAETHEAALDKSARLTKQVKMEYDNNAIKLPTNLLTSTTVTDTDIAALKIFRINAAGTAIELATVDAITNGGDSWGDPIDVSITLDTDSTYDLGTTGVRFNAIYSDELYGLVKTAAQTDITSLGTLTTLTVDNITINANDVSSSTGDITFTPSGVCDFSATNSFMTIPSGTTAQRGSPVTGSFRWNTSDTRLEIYTGSAWQQYAGSSGTWSDPIDSNITVSSDSTYDIGTNVARVKDIYCDNLYGTLQTAAQTNITSVGTLTALTVDNIVTNGNDISSSSGDITLSPTGVVDMTASTDHFLPPTGTTAQRTESTAGELRYNSTTNQLEYYNGTSTIALTANTGSRVFLGSTTASTDTECDLDNFIDSTYDYYEVIMTGITVSVDGVELRARVGTGATPTYQTGSVYQSSSTTTFIDLTATRTIGNAAGETASVEMKIYDPSNTSIYTLIDHECYTYGTSGTVTSREDTTGYSQTTAVTSIRIYPDSGTFSGTARIYGVSNS